MWRYSLRVPAAEAELAMLQMLEWFPAGVQEEREGDRVVLSGFGLRAPDPRLAESEVAEGWQDSWREFHRPVREGRLWVGPPWFEPEPVAVVIDPGRAFGTGAHGSTRAALALLQELQPGPALDLGCGSGVLSIAALRLGFGPLQAFDIDPLAVQATLENAARNGVQLTAGRCDVLCDPLPAAPLWLANLELHLLQPLLARADRPALVLASGLLEGQTVGGTRRRVVDGWAAELVTA
jgi:ribosomal protein L11 methyltransferase